MAVTHRFQGDLAKTTASAWPRQGSSRQLLPRGTGTYPRPSLAVVDL